MRLLLCIAVVLAAIGGVAAAAARHQPPAHTGPLELLAKTGKTVTMKGSVAGLYPGAAKPMVVTVKNANKFTIKVAAVKAKVAAKTTLAGCAGPANVKVKSSTKALKIAKGKSAKATLTVSMLPTAANACQGAKFTLTLSAKAVKG